MSWNYVDRDNDRIVKGAFADTIAEIERKAAEPIRVNSLEC